jgi:hypothetical protein
MTGRRALSVYAAVPDSFAPRASWALQTMLAPLGRGVALVRDPAQSGAAALAYAPVPVPGVPTIPCSGEALESFAAVRPLPSGAFAPRPGAAGDAVGAFAADPATGFAVPFDLVASAFSLLACWDERTSGARDRFGRLPYGASVFAANPGLRLEEPAVDRYVELLRAVLAPRLAELGLPPLPRPGWMWGDGPAGGGSAGARFAIALTHDLDNLWRWTARGFAATGFRSARAVRRRDAAALRREVGDVLDWLIYHLPRRGDPYWTFAQMLGGEDRRGVSSTFFVIASHTHRQDGLQPGTYRKRIPAALELLRRGRREVGLHGNDADRNGAAAVAGDRDDLARRAGSEVSGMRYHYLRCLYHETLAHLEEAGLDYDSSLAFAEHEGFRCGVSFPFHPYSLSAERPLRLLELPLAIMDTSLHGAQYRALSAAAAERVSREVLGRARTAGGAAAVLWHNLRFDPRTAQGYDDVYWRLIDWARAEGALLTSASVIAHRWRERTGPGTAAEAAAAKPAAALSQEAS